MLLKICNAIPTRAKAYCTPRNIYIDVAGDNGTGSGVKHDSSCHHERSPSLRGGAGVSEGSEIAFRPDCLTVIDNEKLKCSSSGPFGRTQSETPTFVAILHINVGVVLEIILTIANSSLKKPTAFHSQCQGAELYIYKLPTIAHTCQ